MGAETEQLKSDRAAAQRSGAVNARTASWPAEQQAAFEALQKAADAYFDAHASGEIDLSGTLRAAFEIKAKDALKAKFDATLDAFEKGKSQTYTAEQFAKADKELNDVYGTTMRHVENVGPETITKDGIRQAERLWLTYVQAWVKFTALRYPGVTADSVKTRLTLERTAVLKTIAVGD